MTDSERRGKKRPTLEEGSQKVPNILEEARRAVDNVTQNQGGAGKIPVAPESRTGGEPGPKRRKAAPRKKPATESGRKEKPSRSPAPKEKPVAAPTPPVTSDKAAAPQLGLTDFGITVKHAIPGRIRLRLYKMLHNETLSERLSSLLATVPGVTSVEASANTGSLLIAYNPSELAAVKSRGGFAGVMRQLFPGLDVTNLLELMLGH
jgi:hypothetical protein